MVQEMLTEAVWPAVALHPDPEEWIVMTGGVTSFTSTSAAEPPTTAATEEEASGMAFPEFGVQTDQANEDHVEVTYDGSTVADEVSRFAAFDAPAEEAVIDEDPVYEIEDDEVVDLRSLGAVETKE